MPLTSKSGFGQNSDKRQLHAIGRAALDGPTAPPLAVEDFFRHQRAEKRDRVPYAALLHGRRNDAHIAEPPQGALHRRQAGRVDAVVVGQKNLHLHKAATAGRGINDSSRDIRTVCRVTPKA